MSSFNSTGQYSVVSPVGGGVSGASPGAPAGTASLQSALNNVQNSLVNWNPQTGFPQITGGSNSTAIYNPAGNNYQPSTQGTPVWNGTQWVSSSGGQPFTGSYFGTTYVNGQSSQQLANDPSSRYQPVNITKSPPIASATTALTGNFNNGLSLQNNNFSDFLSAANDATGAATTGFNNDINNAYNLTPLTNTLNGLNTQYATGVGGLNNTYANNANDLNSQYSGVLGQLAGEENTDASTAQGMLGQYDAAAQAIGQQEADALQQNVSRYAAASGTPTGLGSNEEQTLALGLGDIEVPLNEAEINQGYNVLENYQTPLQQQQAAGAIGQISNFELPLQNTQYGQGLTALNTTYGQDYNTAQGLQNLAISIAGKPISEAVAYMQSMGVPTEIQQQLLGGDIGNLGGLSSLYSGSNYQGLQDTLGASVSQPTGASFNSPGFPGAGGGVGGNTNYSAFAGAGTGSGGAPNMGLPGLPSQPVGQLLPFQNTGWMQDSAGNIWGSNGQGGYYLYQANNQNAVAGNTGSQYAGIPASGGTPTAADLAGDTSGLDMTAIPV